MPTRYQTQNLINIWNNSNRRVVHELTEDGLINVEGEIDLRRISEGWKAISDGGGLLQVRFGVCVSFKATGMFLTSMKGCPKIVTNVFHVCDNKISSLDGLPLSARVIDIRENPITSLTGIAKLTSCEELWLPNSITSNMLGLLQMKSLKRLYCDGNFSVKDDSKFQNAFSIIKKHFDSEHDVIACQEELIDNGLKDYAEV